MVREGHSTSSSQGHQWRWTINESLAGDIQILKSESGKSCSLRKKGKTWEMFACLFSRWVIGFSIQTLQLKGEASFASSLMSRRWASLCKKLAQGFKPGHSKSSRAGLDRSGGSSSPTSSPGHQKIAAVVHTKTLKAETCREMNSTRKFVEF